MPVDLAVDQLSTLIGQRVRAARTSRSLTLDNLADSSGVSRRMIVNVENGSVNASLATLLRLATALRLSLAELVDGEASASTHTITHRSNREPLWRGVAGGHAFLIATADELELWDWVMHPGELYASEAHRPGTCELLHIHEGSLEVGLADAKFILEAGDGASLRTDFPHSYSCKGPMPAHFSMTVLEPTTWRGAGRGGTR